MPAERLNSGVAIKRTTSFWTATPVE